MAPQIKSEHEMFPLVEEWLASGLTQKQFCSNQGMPVHLLAYWVGRYRKAQPGKTTLDGAVTTPSKATKAVATESSSGFIRLSPSPLTPAPAPNQLPAGSVEVIMPTGAVIRFSTIVPAGYLKELLSLCLH